MRCKCREFWLTDEEHTAIDPRGRLHCVSVCDPTPDAMLDWLLARECILRRQMFKLGSGLVAMHTLKTRADIARAMEEEGA